MATIVRISFDEADIRDGLVPSVSKDGFSVRFLGPAEVFSPMVAVSSGRRAVRNAAAPSAAERRDSALLMEFAPPIQRLKLCVGLTEEDREGAGVRATLLAFDADGVEVASDSKELGSGPTPITVPLEVRAFRKPDDIIHRAQVAFDGSQPEVIDDLELESTATTVVNRSIAPIAASDIEQIFGLADGGITQQTMNDITLADTTGSGVLHSQLAEPREGPTPDALIVGAVMYRIDLSDVRSDTPGRGVASFSINDAYIEAVDYANRGDNLTEDVFVVVDGGPGSVGPSSADQLGDRLTFRFDPPLLCGGPDGAGESSFFFGFAQVSFFFANIKVAITDTEGRQYSVTAVGPA